VPEEPAAESTEPPAESDKPAENQWLERFRRLTP